MRAPRDGKNNGLTDVGFDSECSCTSDNAKSFSPRGALRTEISLIIALRLKEQCQILIIGIVITYPFNCIYLLDLLGMITIEK